MKANELMEKVTAKVIASIEAGLGLGKWEKPWSGNGDVFYAPKNVTTGKFYSGGNFLVLGWYGMDAGYDNGIWGTYKQWQSIDAQVKKGETGTQGVKWVEKKCKDHAPDERCHSCGQMFPTVFTLFNACQVDGYEYAKPVVNKFENQDERSEKVDAFFTEVGATLKEGGAAYYTPQSDTITMPPFAEFKDAAFYYSTLAHEHVHWTGHKDRMNREEIYDRSRANYASEELVAELGATMLCAILGIEEQPREDHAQYLHAWLQHLNDDKWALYKASTKASKATTYLLQLGKIESSADEREEVSA